jgi:hypothetical protein
MKTDTLTITIAKTVLYKHEDTHVKTDGTYSWIRFSNTSSCPFCIAKAIPMVEDKQDTLSLAHYISANAKALVTAN